MEMGLIDNVNVHLKDDVAREIRRGSHLAIAAAYFSIYAFAELKSELSKIKELRFIFTDPTFVASGTKSRQQREFYISPSESERSICGNVYEVKLRNELKQSAIARECADWVRKKVRFRSNISGRDIPGFLLVDAKAYAPLKGFTTVDLGCERGNSAFTTIIKVDSPLSSKFLANFDSLWQDREALQDVTEQVLASISAAYKENAPEAVYYFTLYNIFREYLEDITADELPNERTGFKESKIWGMLFNFQKDAACGIISKLERYNGCILADSVGLGKTFTALAVIKYYEMRNKSVLVLCPKKLGDNWNTYRSNYVNNPLAADRFNYAVLYHTDLSRTHGFSNGMDLSKLNWGNFDLIVIDESHNFRNGGQIDEEGKENRYTRLMNKVMRAGVRTKVLMLSATPVNNRFQDLRNQLQLAYEGSSQQLDDKLNTQQSIDEIFHQAQKAYNKWAKLKPSERTLQNLLDSLQTDFFTVLDAVTIARSRKHITRYYDTAAIGKFPRRLAPLSQCPSLTDLAGAITYREIFRQLMELELTIYTPSHYIHASRQEKYAALYGDSKIHPGLTQANREKGIRRLMAINILKRMESSVHAFRLTVERVKQHIESTLGVIERYKINYKMGVTVPEGVDINALDLDMEDESYVVGGKSEIALADMDYLTWEESLRRDAKLLGQLLDAVAPITPERDAKLKRLKEIISNKLKSPINEGNKKILIFTAFADTASYLYEHISKYAQKEAQLNTAMITGSVEGRSTVRKLHTDLNTVLTCFAPLAKDKKLLLPQEQSEIDILIATDCISEGQNLQDCDYLINYDIHWNPVRIIQRFGRIDRIGSKNAVVQLVNFWPDMDLDEYINLKGRVESRMKIVDIAATGDDNLLSEAEKMDFAYRKEQLQRLQKEVVDLEEMGSGISILDLGLNEFRMDLKEYFGEHPELEKLPRGLMAVVPASAGCPSGVIYVLKSLTAEQQAVKRNQLHPHYIIYISAEGEIVCHYTGAKKCLEYIRKLCRGKAEPCGALCAEFNAETKDGKDMRRYTQLLREAISSISEQEEASDIDSFLEGKDMSFCHSAVKGMDDYELVSFIVVKNSTPVN